MINLKLSLGPHDSPLLPYPVAAPIVWLNCWSEKLRTAAPPTVYNLLAEGMATTAAAKLLHFSCQLNPSRPFCSSTPRVTPAAALPLSGLISTKLQRRALEAAISPLRASSKNDGIVRADDDGVSLGTMKLPPGTDIARFETLLFQVDKVAGGARLGFIKVEDGKTEVCAYIDCLVVPATDGSGPVFRAIRNGPLKDQVPPGEPRIMRSLLQALQTSVGIARI
ncbi:hypothetical protein BHE74_00043485 [Ensete ventricosum]|nr:hypothetical protein BHE74_00043485 [Ensete ventricosum]RZS13899.1 hypothetical protein BHM03_00045533 [Ensete ventricosum]